MTQSFAATVSGLISPIAQASAELDNAKAALGAYTHPLYAGPCGEIATAEDHVVEAMAHTTLALNALEALQKRLVGDDPARVDVGEQVTEAGA